MQNKITTVVGRKGNGKTTWVQEETRSVQRLIVVDHLREYRDGLIFTSLESLMQYFETDPQKFRCICRFTDDDEVSALLSFAYELGNLTLVCEEVDKILCSPNWIDDNLYALINFGRHRQVDLICCARRAGDVHRTLRASVDEIVTFNQKESKDLDYLEERGFNRTEVASLEKYNKIIIQQ